MRQAGIWVSRAERKRIQQPRYRREYVGELVQIDGSEHRWSRIARLPVRCWYSSMMQQADAGSWDGGDWGGGRTKPMRGGLAVAT